MPWATWRRLPMPSPSRLPGTPSSVSTTTAGPRRSSPPGSTDERGRRRPTCVAPSPTTTSASARARPSILRCHQPGWRGSAGTARTPSPSPAAGARCRRCWPRDGSARRSARLRRLRRPAVSTTTGRACGIPRCWLPSARTRLRSRRSTTSPGGASVRSTGRGGLRWPVPPGSRRSVTAPPPPSAAAARCGTERR